MLSDVYVYLGHLIDQEATAFTRRLPRWIKHGVVENELLATFEHIVKVDDTVRASENVVLADFGDRLGICQHQSRLRK